MSNTEWNQYHEELLKKWAEMSKTYNIMHSLCVQYYTSWSKRLGVPIIILGAITASSIFSNNSSVSSAAWTYVNGAMALLMTVLSGISNFLGIAEKTNKHQTASYKFSKIGMDIDMLLAFPRKNRSMAPEQFIEDIKTEILSVRENVPEILPWIMADYINKLDKTLTNTTSNVNMDEENCFPSNFQPELRRELHYEDSGIQESQSKEQDITAQDSVSQCASKFHKHHPSLHIDFTDKMAREVCKASQKISQLHNGSQSPVSSKPVSGISGIDADK